MARLKLGRIPDRTPIKLAITITPDLKDQLDAYAEAYGAAYGQQEKVEELIPFMLQSFVDSDRGFARSRKAGMGRGEAAPKGVEAKSAVSSAE
ncbi:MAG: DUF2274 domain-containing protein [Alphaproteobacteria bacterium]